MLEQDKKDMEIDKSDLLIEVETLRKQVSPSV